MKKKLSKEAKKQVKEIKVLYHPKNKASRINLVTPGDLARPKSQSSLPTLYSVIVEVEVDIPRPLPVEPHKVGITLWSLVLGVASQHALQTHAHALDVVNGAPSLLVEKVEADDAVRVDVRVHRNNVGRIADKGDLRRFCDA